jgi:hypothetical protein
MTIERPVFPPRAESVDSFSAQPAIGRRENRERISESRKPAEGLSRRSMIGALAMLPAALPPAAASMPDPVFAAIETHRQAHAAHQAAIEEGNQLEKLGGDWTTVTEKPCHDENVAFEALIRAAATTQQGLLAKLAYLRAIAESDEAWMHDERDGTALDLMKSFAGSLQTIWGVQA